MSNRQSRTSIYKALRAYPRSFVWVAEKLEVSVTTLSLWLRLIRSSPNMDARIPQLKQLLQEIERTQGSCLPKKTTYPRTKVKRSGAVKTA